jgi:hypothetical protein
LKADTGSFIPDKYHPPGMIVQDPRNMQLGDIRKVLQHCYGLQAESGPESSFRFALFCGPKRKRLFANYPNTELVESEHRRRKKNKGKQREDLLQGLLRMDESEPPDGDHIPGPTEIVGQQINAIINPPLNSQSSTYTNLATLPLNNTANNTNVIARSPTLNPQNVAQIGGADPDPTDVGPQTNAIINPPLNSQSSSHTILATLPSNNTANDTNVNERPPTPNQQNVAEIGGADPGPIAIGSSQVTEQIEPGHISNTNIRPTTPPITDADVGANTFKTPKKRLGKRAQKNLTPQTLPQNQNANKKKKVTDDDLAALEAQNMVQAGSRRRSKPTWRK